MDEAEECGRIALMRAGRVIALGSPAALKKQAFPERLVEIQWKDSPPAGWQSTLLAGPAVSVVPYGLFHHILIQDPAGWNRFMSTHSNQLVARDIQPSLEDVFIRLVEGVDR
jgi:ABC-2 type transport system ATP-binding protein